MEGAGKLPYHLSCVPLSIAAVIPIYGHHANRATVVLQASGGLLALEVG